MGRTKQFASLYAASDWVQGLGNSEQYRHYKNVNELNRVSAWIREQMRVFGIPCQFQNYVVNQQSYRNVVCKLNVGAAQKTDFWCALRCLWAAAGGK